MLARDPDRRALAIELALAWIAANLLWQENRLDLLPLVDWVIGAHAVYIARKRMEKWVWIFVGLIALRLTLHVGDYLSSHAFMVLYIHGLNATFALLLLVVSHAGRAHARDHLLGCLSRLGARLRSALRAPSSGLSG